MANNSEAKIVTISEVGGLLEKEGILFQVVEDGQSADLNGVMLEAFGKEHAPIYEGIENVLNTGYLVADKFYHPGDAYHQISKPVEVLALPLSAPWGKISESIDFAKAVKPKTCFPVHDGMLKELGPFAFVPETILTPLGIEFVVLTAGQMLEL